MSWPTTHLADQCDVITKGTTPTTLGHDFTDSGVPFLRVQNIERGSITLERETLFIDESTHHILERSQIHPGDVLVSIAGTIGRAGIVPDDAPPLNCNQAVAIVRVRKNVHRPFLRHWLESGSAQAQMRSATVTGTIANLSLTQLGNLRIPFPPVSEQRRIAAILDKADELRAKRRAALVKLDTLTESIFLDMFGDPATNPKNYPVALMGDVCDVRDGTHDSPKYVSDSGYPLVTSKNVTGGAIDLTEVNYISEADYIQINKRSKVDKGDIILPMIGTIGSPVLVDHDPNYAIKNVALIKFIEGSPAAVYLHHLLSGRYFDHIVSRKNRGGTQKFVSLGDLRAFPLPLPPRQEQDEFLRRMEEIRRIRSLNSVAASRLDDVFTSLQSHTFRGEL